MGGGITFQRPHSYLSFGIRGSGKSSLLECIAEQFLYKNSPVVDLFGSRDGEGLTWLRSPWADDKKILLLCGDNSSVASSFDVVNVSRFTRSHMDKYDIIISSAPLYSSIDVEYADIHKITKVLFERKAWKKVGFLIVREAANLLYSRLKLSSEQKMAKIAMAYFCREARHSGFALGLDTGKMTSIDLDVRTGIEYLFLNQDIAKLGKCPKCKRAKSEHAETTIPLGRWRGPQ